MITRLNVGGPARHVVWLTSAMNNDEFETLLVTGAVPPGEDDLADFASAHGVVPVTIKQMTREISAGDARTIWKVYRLLVRFRPDVVHTHTAKAGTVGRLAGLIYCYLTPALLLGKPRRCRFVHTYHGHIFHSYYGRLKTTVFLTIERILARIVTDRIIVLSDQQFREIHEDFRIGRREQFAIVPLGIDLTTIRSDSGVRHRLREFLRTTDSETLVGIVGRLTPIKNQDLFLRVATHFGSDVRFAIFGDGADRPKLERRVSELQLGDRMRFAGVRTPAEIYASIDIVALTSLNEGTPLALLEAMANEIPIISTAVGGVVDLLGSVEETVSAGNTGYEIRERGITVKSMDEAGLVAGLARLIRDGELRRRLSERGLQFVENNYSKERLVTDIIRLTRDLTS